MDGKSLGFELSKLNDEKLARYAEFLLRQYRLVDAYWFLKVEARVGLNAATDFNEDIWTELGEVAARDVMKYMGVEKGDLEHVLEALKYFPWMIIAYWKIAELSEKKAVIFAERCPPQEARIKSGSEIFSCKSMEQKCLQSFIRVYNNDIRVICRQAPPDTKHKDYWCLWELVLD